MLLFIFINLWKPPLNVEFKYISCYYLSMPAIRTTFFQNHSNTSHVIIYLELVPALAHLHSHSNTSHVIIYLAPMTFCNKAFGIQIHLMLLFIMPQSQTLWKELEIQIPLMLLFILSALNFATLSSNSNTSHVIIYLLPLVKGQDPLSFKYISCYYLSMPCYVCAVHFWHSNTSHVIIYLTVRWFRSGL